MDAITLLRNDHKTVEQLFKRFEKAGDAAYVEKRRIVDRIIEELSVHAVVEELVFYPVVRAAVPNVEDITLESLEEHHIVKWVLSELEGMDPRHERFDAKVTVLMENVRHHVEEEQDELFAKVRSTLSRAALNELGQALADAKRTAPTHPHPRAPDTPPANVLAGAVAGVVDRVGDNISGIAQGSVSAVQDLIGRITGTDRMASSPTGTSAARSRAASVRSGVDDAVKRARDAGEDAASGVRSAAARASASAPAPAKRAAASATSRAKSAAGAAKKASPTGGSPSKSTAKSTARKATTSTAKKAAPKKAGPRSTAKKAAPRKAAASHSK
jgi:hemerythrin superfamily protein